MQSFLPEEYEVPKEESSFLNKFPEGITTLRVLSPVTTGFRYWNIEGKPVYSKNEFTVVPADADLEKDGGFNPQYMWIFAAWHYEDNRIKVVQVSQKTVMAQITDIYNTKEWGDPSKYDLKIQKTGNSMNDTKYGVQPKPHSELLPEITTAMKEATIKLENTFTDERVIEANQLPAATQPTVEIDPVQELGAPTKEELQETVDNLPFK